MIRRTMLALAVLATALAVLVGGAGAAQAGTGHHGQKHRQAATADRHKADPGARVRKARHDARVRLRGTHDARVRVVTSGCQVVCVPKPRKPGAVSCKPHCAGHGPKLICHPVKHPGHVVHPRKPVQTPGQPVTPAARVRLVSATVVPNLPRTGSDVAPLLGMGTLLLGSGVLSLLLGSRRRVAS